MKKILGQRSSSIDNGYPFIACLNHVFGSLFLIGFFAISVYTGNSLAYDLPPTNETLAFRVRWKLAIFLPSIELGEVTIRYAGEGKFGGKPVLIVEGTAISTPSFRFPVKDYFICYVSPDHFQSIHARNLLQEGGKKSEQFFFYYPSTHNLWFKEYTRDPKKSGESIVSRNELYWNVPFPIHDAGGLALALRSGYPQEEPPFSVVAAFLATAKEITVTKDGEEKLSTVLGTMNAYRYRVANLLGYKDKEDYFYIWATPDRRHIPLRFKAKVKYGWVEGNLTRYCFNSKSIIPDALPWEHPLSESTPDISSKLTPIKFTLPNNSPEMVTVPGGMLQFGAGTSQRKNICPVSVDSFAIDRQEVTNADYKRFVDATGHAVPSLRPYEYYKKQYNWKPDNYADMQRLSTPYCWRDGTYPPGRGNYPVVLVRWEDAATYARWAGKRLPTEAEWEMAARGALSGMDYPWGNQVDPSRANTAESDFLGLVPTGYIETGKNALGLMDMCGNVAEWTADWYDDSPFSSGQKNPRGPTKGEEKVIRGGSWKSPLREGTVWFRGHNVPDLTYPYVGFRCVKDVSRIK